MIAPLPCGADVIDYHGADALLSRVCLHKVASEFRSDHFGNMLVFADRHDFFFRETGQLDTVVERQHDGALFGNGAERKW